MSLADIQSGLFVAVENNLVGIPIAYPNTLFTHTTKQTWAELHFVANDPSVGSLGENGYDEVDGFVQVDINIETGVGDKIARDLYETLRSAFSAGTGIVYNLQTAIITSCERVSGRIVDGWYKTSVTISWYANIQR